MDPSFWALLLAKMLLAAAIVVSASMIVERSGPFLGAMVATLPISAGPAFAFLATEHSAEFISESALAGLPVTAATVVYMVVYATVAQRRGVLASIGAGFAVWAAFVFLILQGQWTLGGALALNGAVFAAALVYARRLTGADKPPRLQKRSWDVLFRASLVMVLVGGTVLAGRTLGPAIAAATALAPVVLISLALILQPRIGGIVTASVVANGVPGMLGFVGALSVIHLGAVPMGAFPALLLALTLSLGWNATLVALRSRRMNQIRT
ncbi:hypothetical protein [Microvirga sp. M2]|uniref:hypothetical protein n=1 Tax=Microvirga sp. M2 TaxID=3073270 RepID=UPI0039C247D8